MKRLLLLVAVFVGTMSLSAQRNMQVWEGNTYSEFSTEVVDSVTFLLSPEGVLRECKADTVLVTKTDTVEKIVTEIDTVTVVKYDTIYKPDIGVFLVSEDKLVSFAPGNLQYTQSTNTWSFAKHQYDVIGTANVVDTVLADKIDLFGWSISWSIDRPGIVPSFGVDTSTNAVDYFGDFVDWGTNTIGNDAPNTWRTLTIDEWIYLFQHTRWTMARVNGILGFMLLPNGFTAPSGMTVAVLGDGKGKMSGSSKRFKESYYASNQYTADEFAQFEMRGCIFLPCAGYRLGSSVGEVGSGGYYWSATSGGLVYAKYLYFYSASADANDFWWCHRGQSVRLVQDIKWPR